MADPVGVTGCVGWWDASDQSTITVTGAGVSAWTDKSGAGRTLSQATDGNRPLTGGRQINGLNAVEFVSSDNVASANMTEAQPVTVFVVANSDTTAQGATNRQLLGNGSIAQPVIYMSGADPANWILYASNGVDSGVDVNTRVHVFSAVFNGASSQLWLDGASIAAGNAGASGWVAVPIRFGNEIGNAGPWDGLMGEGLLYQGALTAANRQLVEAYLTTKWLRRRVTRTPGQAVKRSSVF